MKNYTPKTRNFSQSVPNVEVTDTNHADNINAASKQLIENDNYLKDRMDDEGFLSWMAFCVRHLKNKEAYKNE